MTKDNPLHPHYDPPPPEVPDFWWFANRTSEVWMRLCLITGFEIRRVR
jgi:hypothetical protein